LTRFHEVVPSRPWAWLLASQRGENMATAPTGGSPVDTRPSLPVALRKAPHRIPQVVGVIPAGVLVNNYDIPRRDYAQRSGYQRPVSPSRVNKLVADLVANRVDLPTALLLNIRDYKEGVHLVHLAEEKGAFFFRPDGPFYVVDGQHRIEALAKLIERDPERWSDFPIPFVCLLGADEFEEMTEFYVVNSTAKSVRTDLAYDLLRQRAEADPSLMEALLERGEHWKVEGKLVTEQLTSGSPLWKGRVRFPGEPLGETLISSAGMVTSLRPLLLTPYFEAISMSDKVEVLSAFWEGTASVLPDAFSNPPRYALQKSTGVQVMHKLLIVLLENLRSLGESVLNPESFEKLLRGPLLHLEGDTASGDTVRGADFWKVGAVGAAGSFSNNAGRRVLTARLKGALPNVKAT
jgi:DGQHR domain-containing protein